MSENNDQTAFDPEEIPRAVFAVGMEAVTEGYKQPAHSHRKAQLIMTLRGLVTCEVAKGLWMVPPHCALWIGRDGFDGLSSHVSASFGHGLQARELRA